MVLTYIFSVNRRGQSTWRPHVTPTGNLPSAQGGHLGNNIPTVTKTSLAHRRPQEEEHIGCGYNNSARPFNAVRISCFTFILDWIEWFHHIVSYF